MMEHQQRWAALWYRLTNYMRERQCRPGDNRMNIFGPRLPKHRDRD